ncbi:MAG: MBL fold metallo-hydrolase [Spirosomataceae bacterium]
MQLYTIDAGRFKLDGGAMFGVVPKTLWSKQIQPDDNNLCSWMMRCLLIEDGNRLILIDTGMGHKQDPRWQGFYYRHGDGELVKSIQAHGFSPTDVTDVILSHLHFDHAGGAVQWNSTRDRLELTFPHARYWSHSAHWDWASQPNAREKATFLKENIMPIQESGQLYFVDKEPTLFDNIEIRSLDGHTEKMLLCIINNSSQKIAFMADLVPSHIHLPIAWVMSYDLRPLVAMEEKQSFLQEALNNQYVLFFDHDPQYDCCRLEQTERGIRPSQVGSLSEFV